MAAAFCNLPTAAALDSRSYFPTTSSLGPDQLQKILGDHGPSGAPSDDSLCMHGNYWTTTASLQWFPRQRKARVAYGSTCEAKYVEFQLN